MIINKKLGFTILELTVVIVLIAILAATAIPKLFGLTNDAHESVARSIKTSIEASLQGYYAEAQVRSNGDEKEVSTSVAFDGTRDYFLDWNELFNPINIDWRVESALNNKGQAFSVDKCKRFLSVLTNLTYSEINNNNGKWITEVEDIVYTTVAPNSVDITYKKCIWTYQPTIEKNYKITYDPTKKIGENIIFEIQ